MSKFYYFRKSIILICILFIVSVSQVFAVETATTLRVIPTLAGNQVSVSVEYNSTNMCGGSLNFTYDTTALSLVSVEEGETIKNISHFINPEFADGVIRVNWVSTTEMAIEGNLINIQFELLNGSLEKADVGIEKLKIADGNGNKQEADYIIVYENSEQTTLPTESESEDAPSTDTPEDNAGINQGNVSNNSSSGSNSSSSLKPSSDNSAEKQETVINTTKTTIEFIDVKETAWFYTNVKYVVDNNLMKGISETEFAPSNTLTRAMLVTVLYRNTGEPAVNEIIPFADVDMGSYYANAVSWAKQNGIVSGVTENEFAPDSNITREQIATILFRYAQYKGMEAITLGENLHFVDSDEISEYAISAMNWAVGKGLMKGKSETTLNPKDNATRAEIAAILQRFIEGNK